MIENEMGYRGSKSEIKPKEISVKEQRVDGSYFDKINKSKLRYTLMGFERSYQVRFLSNQINKNNRLFSTQLNPYFVTGFCDAESSFQVLVTKNKNTRLG